MSFHTVTMMIRWILTNNDPRIQTLRSFSYDVRLKNQLTKDLVNELKEKWNNGSRIEKLAVLGWNDFEAQKLLCDIIQDYNNLKIQFDTHTSIYGSPSEITDENLELYIQTVIEQIHK